MSNCRFYEDGKCIKGQSQCECKPWCPEDFFEGFGTFDTFEDACAASSIFGNSAVYITEEDIADLRNGKILMHDDGEYCTLVILKGETGNET